MSDPQKPVTPEWLKMPKKPLKVVSIITIHDGCVCEAWQDDDEWFAVGPKGVEVITPRIYQPMPPMPTDEEIAALNWIEGGEP